MLADWLAASGYDARVVLGEQADEGHAWVVLNDGGRHYILESTGGLDPHRRTPPLSAAATDYVPRVQFDRTGVWFRTSHGWTADYSSHQQWTPGPWPAEVDDPGAGCREA